MYNYILLPHNFNVKLIKKNVITKNYIICLYNYFFMCYLTNLNYNKFMHGLQIKNKNLLTLTNIQCLYSFLMQLTTYFLKKIYFQGKGYKIRKIKNFNFLEFFFGFCHFTIINFLNYKLKLRKKWSFLIFYNTNTWLLSKLAILQNLKLWNVYTSRGLRIKKQIKYKKPKRKATFI